MLSPVWVFNTGIARPFMERVAAMSILSPTPKFWRNKAKFRAGIEGQRNGSDQAHAIVYIGPNGNAFLRPSAYGIAARLQWLAAA